MKSGLFLKIKYSDNDLWEHVKLTSRSGKCSGKYKNCWNTTNSAGMSKSIDFDVCDWKIQTPIMENDDEVLLSEASESRKSSAVLQAKMNELQSWKDEQVYTEVDNAGQSVISVRWVISVKPDERKQDVVKARLCARGFEENQDFRTDSPTCKRESVRIVLLVISSHSWILNSIDIKRAFLQGKRIEREVFIKPPKEASTDKLWRLDKCIYGLADAPRSWYLTFSRELVRLGCTVSKYDPSVFFFFHKDILNGVMACFVDDEIWGGTDTFKKLVVDKLYEKFEVGSTHKKIFSFLGIYLHQQEDMSIVIDQNSFASSLNPIEVSAERLSRKHERILPAEEKQLRSLIGQLNWLSGISRPEVSFDVSAMTSRIKDATIEDLLYCNKVLKQVQSHPTSILFPKIDVKSMALNTFCDSSFNNLPNGGSQGAYVILLKDNSHNVVPIAWSSTKVRRVARSTVTAETLALLDGCDAAFFYTHLILEVLGISSIPIHVMTDNQSLYENVHSSKNTVEKRLVVDIAALREMVNKKEILLYKIDSSKNLSNVLTKKGAPSVTLTEPLQEGKLA